MMSPQEYFSKMISTLTQYLRSPDPREVCYINFAVTYLCNSRCKHCNIWKRYEEDPEKAKTELELEEIKEVFEKSSLLKEIKEVNLTGGEPFLRKDFVELCSYFAQKYPQAKIVIPTNAVNPYLVIDKLSRIVNEYNARNIYLPVSLDGIGEVHDKIRGMAGNYERALRLIQLVKKEVPSVKLSISFTITPDNYKELFKVYKLSKELGVGFCCQFAQISENYYVNAKTQFKWNETKLKEVEAALALIVEELNSRKNIVQRLIRIDTCYYLNMVSFQRNPHRVFRCYSGTHSLFMDPYGDVYPCIMLNKRIGNVREASFDRIYLSKKARSIRQFIKSKKCACWTPCETHPSLAKDYRVVLFNLSWNLRRMLNKRHGGRSSVSPPPTYIAAGRLT